MARIDESASRARAAAMLYYADRIRRLEVAIEEAQIGCLYRPGMVTAQEMCEAARLSEWNDGPVIFCELPIEGDVVEPDARWNDLVLQDAADTLPAIVELWRSAA